MQREIKPTVVLRSPIVRLHQVHLSSLGPDQTMRNNSLRENPHRWPYLFHVNPIEAFCKRVRKFFHIANKELPCTQEIRKCLRSWAFLPPPVTLADLPPPIVPATLDPPRPSLQPPLLAGGAGGGGHPRTRSGSDAILNFTPKIRGLDWTTSVRVGGFLGSNAQLPIENKESWRMDITAVYVAVWPLLWPDGRPPPLGEIETVVERNKDFLQQFYIGLLKRYGLPAFDRNSKQIIHYAEGAPALPQRLRSGPPDLVTVAEDAAIVRDGEILLSRWGRRDNF